MSRPVTFVLYDDSSVLGARIVQILADWCSAGWVSDFALLSLSEVTSSGRNIAGIRAVVPATATAAREPMHLGSLLDHHKYRLLVLDPLGSSMDWAEQRAHLHKAATALYQARPDKRVGAIDLMVPWHGARWDPDAPTWHGWDTLIAAPETSASVSEGGLALHAHASDHRSTGALAAHAAAFAAACAGLWTGVPESPYDNSSATDDVRMGRAFHRRMDASAMADRLRARVLDVQSLRDPMAQQSDTPAVLERRVRELQSRILLAPMPAAPPAPKPTAVSARQAITMFFSFMFKALLGSPAALVNGLVYRGKAAAARGFTNAIFGQDSVMTVAVGGVTADGSPLSLDQREDRLDGLRHAVRGIPAVREVEGLPAAGQRPFWAATFDTAWALVSGTTQGSAEAFVSEGGPRHFAVERIAPAIPAPWSTDGGLAVTGLPQPVIVTDIRAVRQAAGLLTKASTEQDGRVRAAADRNLASLRAASQPWADSLFGRVGIMIVDGIAHYDAIVDGMLARLEELAEVDDSEAQEIARRLSRFAKLTTAVFALLAVGVGVLTFLEVLLIPLFIALPILLIGWLVGLAAKYWSMQKRIFQVRYRATAADAEFDRVSAQLPYALENAYRMGRLYSQYLLWSKVASAFLREPFGRSGGVRGGLHGMTGYVPKSVACGVYEVSDETQAIRVSAKIALGLRYPIATLWSEFVSLGLTLLADSQPQFAAKKPEDVFGESEVSIDGPLRSWLATALTEDELGVRISNRIAHDIDERQMGRLIRNVDPEQRSELLRAHRVVRLGAGGLAMPERLSTNVTIADFHQDAFSPHGMSMRVVDPTVSVHLQSELVKAGDTRHWMDEVDTVMVLTPQLMLRDLALATTDDPTDGGGDDSPRPAEVPV